MQTQKISGFQLAAQQKRLWHLQQHSSAFCSQCIILIDGNLQPEILQNAIEEIINYHDILKTSFYCPPGLKTPVMVVADKGSFNWEYLDLSDSSQEDIATKVQEIFWQERQEYQKFEQVSLLRLYLIKLSNNQHILIISLPALCADTKTIKNLVNQINQAYAQYCQGQALSADYVQYVQFSEWQNQLLADEDAEKAKAYWQKQKISSLSALKLPHERQGKSEQFILDSYQLAISQELSDKIYDFAQKYDKTSDVILLACWQILIWRITRESEIVIGTATSRREYEELNDVLGLLATWLPIKTQFTPNLNFTEVLFAVAQTLDNAAEWQDYFVPEAVEENNWIAFPIGFEFANISETKSDNKTVKFSLQDIYSVIEPFKVKLTCLQDNRGLITEFDYDSNYFSQETIQRIAKNFQTLLINLINNSDTPISQLGILSASERQQLLIEFNQTTSDYQREICIHQLFEKQVEKTPDAVAVVFKNEKITYQELNDQANQLAHYLQNLGVKPEVVVGICVERNIKFIISLLAVLKAGGAYLPLDPTLPQEALQFRLQDAQAAALIRETGIVDGEHLLDITEVNLENDWEKISQENTDNPVNNVQPKNLVYIIYTSGSTGKPKGVAVEHQQLLNYLYGILPKLQLPTNASYATVSTFAADLGNTVIFPCLSSGGCLHIVSWERASDPAALADYFRLHPIDCLKIVPSHLAALLSSEFWEIVPRQLLILGGEAADWNLIEKIEKNAPHCRVLNHYGPTETTVGVLTYCLGEKIQDTATVPIGKPIANTQVYVLDANLQPVPLGVAGELYIGGESLARGYLNQSELTAQRFINCQFIDSQKRLYKTGDRVRYLSNGNLEFLGRLDDQVKIRGYRIELGEISTALSQHPAVKENVVIAREETSTEKRLVAYIVPTSHAVSDHDFRDFLKAKLPEYMIPTSFVILKSLPLTANGKLDRHALPAPEEVVSRETTFIAPRTPVEEVLAGIWTQLLGVKQVSINDNFFELGGHSLLATQVISRIRTTFNVEIPLPQLFESANLAALAAQIEIAMRGEQQEIKTITPVPRNQNLPLSFAQQRLWFFDQFEPGSPSYNLPRAVRLQGKLNIEALSTSLNEIIKRHEILRTSFVISDGQPIQVISPSVNLKLPLVDLQNIPQKQQKAELYRLANEEAQTGFNLTQAPLLRAKLLQLNGEDFVILLTLHHIVSDGWSTDILIREVAALYTAFCAGKPSFLPQLPIQYADFAIWQRQWLEGEGLKNQLAYWQQQLSGELPILQLPTDRPRPTVQTYAGKTLSFVLPTSLSEGLKTLSKQEGVTLFMTLLAAFKTLLYRYTNQTDILVGSPIANRNRAEIENLIGFFVNTLVLRSNLSGNPTFRDFLKQMREVALGAYTHQDLPFEKLVEEIQPERNLSHNPLFQVMFVLQNAPIRQLELPGLKVEPLENKGTTAKFDLTLVIEDVEQGLIANFEYNTDLFDEITISRLAANFEVLLTGIVANPQQQIRELPLLTATEQQQLLDWGKGEISLQPELCLHQLFEAQVEKTPDAVAVVFVDAQSAASQRVNQQLTYRELNTRANQLAHYLQKLGVEPEVLVGICVERSLEMVIGLLAILKAGGAYIPLDPAYPKERLGYMLADSQLSVLLTQKSLLENLPIHHTQVVCLDVEGDKISQQIADNPINKITPENLAYLIYTSGSTGKPKGVQISHGAVVNFLIAMRQKPGLTAQDILLSVTTLSFDIAGLEIYLPLTVGAQTVIVSRQEASDGIQLSKRLNSCGATVMQATPATWRMLLSAGWIGNKQLKILCGGEALDYTLAQQLQERGKEVWNLYGPTETTIWSAASQVQNSVAIANPIANTQFYILDSYNQLVPIGVAGELHIGGAGLARGYLHQPELTAEKFISNSFNQNAADRLYKTGDLVRYQPDGTIEFLGRIDHQVKIRGFRIELGEIESGLNQHPDVEASVVIVREDKPGDQRLVAYIVSKSQPEINIIELRSFLQEKLPTYMRPTAFVILDKLPLTPNGKVDRKALPVPDTSIGLEASFVPPRTPTEQIVADIWADILGLEKVGIFNNFFELGGHSLLATQVISRLREAFKIDLPLRSFFENPTIKNLVERIEGILAVQQLQAVNEQITEDREEIEL
ncbi:non-ribosomal peptide synthetase [Anabaena lutea]|uniref:Amino acid adenylation domain-containing protein n=1 Tax=Anabaena lutea FACHB-196 TaxID=2692881 RepID=A0ABR8FAX6_9NOST|nr:non-ribosomal peptide synthetase [Anabaena lutea]MBD2567365.1 amino acid adenylation domain-containing protein [Anabaena lutea FACHB-196]